MKFSSSISRSMSSPNGSHPVTVKVTRSTVTVNNPRTSEIPILTGRCCGQALAKIGARSRESREILSKRSKAVHTRYSGQSTAEFLRPRGTAWLAGGRCSRGISRDLPSSSNTPAQRLSRRRPEARTGSYVRECDPPVRWFVDRFPRNTIDKPHGQREDRSP